MLGQTQKDRNQKIWQAIQEARRSQQLREAALLEELSFFVFRSDTNAILARGIMGYEAAKQKADQIRKQQGLPWSVVKFRAEPRAQRSSPQRREYGVSRDGRSFTDGYGRSNRIDYSRNYNPSKGRRFRGYYDKDGNFHDID